MLSVPEAATPLGICGYLWFKWSSLAPTPIQCFGLRTAAVAACCLGQVGNRPDCPATSPRNLPEILYQSGAPPVVLHFYKAITLLWSSISDPVSKSQKFPPEHTDFGFAAPFDFIFFTVTVLNLGRKAR